MPSLSSARGFIPKAWSAVKTAVISSPLDEYAVASANTIVKGAGGIGSTLSIPVLATAGAILSVSEGLFPQGLTSEEQEQKAIAEAEAKLSAQANSGSSSVIQAAPPPPFTGGQGQGVYYTIRVSWYDEAGVQKKLLTGNIYGQVTGFSAPYEYIFDDPNAAFGTICRYAVEGFDRHGQPFTATNESVAQAKIVGEGRLTLSRVDGQPDTDGNIYTGDNIESESTSLTVPALAVNPGSIVGILKPGYASVSKSVPSLRTPVRIINDLPQVPEEKIISARPETDLIPSVATVTPKPIPIAPDLPALPAIPTLVQAIPKSTKADIQQEIDVNPSVAEPINTIRQSVAGSTPVTIKTHTDGNGITTTTTTVTATGKTVSIKRSVPAGVTVRPVGIGSSINRTANTGTFVIGTPTVTGIDTTPVIPSINQAPAIPEVAGLGLTAAAVAGVVYGEKGIQTLTAAAAAGTCQTTQPGGCMQNNVVNPIKAGQASLGELFNNLANTGLAVQNAAILSIVTNTNQAVRHATYGLQAIQGFAQTAWSFTKSDKILNAINTTLLIHNASMLSQNIAVTVGDVISNGLEAIGIKDAEGQAINFNEVVGSSITNLITSVIGAENYASLSTNWAKANRIYQTGVNVLSNVRSIIDTTQDIAETAGENVSLIGNALKKSGVVRENSYPWMPENLNTESRWLNRLDKIQDSVEIFEDIIDNARDISEELSEMKENSTKFKEEIDTKKKNRLEEEDENKNIAIRLPELKEDDEDRFIEENDE